MDKEMLIAKNEIEEKGFLDVNIDPTLDLFSEIEKLKKEKREKEEKAKREGWTDVAESHLGIDE